MMRFGLACVGVFVLTAPLCAVSDQDVSVAMEQMQNWLYEQQDEHNGGWDQVYGPGTGKFEMQVGGETALVLLALLQSGESFQSPRVAKGLEYLERLQPGGTYATSLRVHVWAQLPDSFRPRLRREAILLQQAGFEGKFGYAKGPNAKWMSYSYDHSTTQYGVLGMWEYAKRGGHVPDMFWLNTARHFISAQNDDGGWGYTASRDSRGSMTTAGLTVLYIARQQARRRPRKLSLQINLAIDAGERWLDSRFDSGHNFPSKSSGFYNYYYLYGIERVALASGIKVLNGQDWFEAGAAYIIKDLRRDGSINNSVYQTAFALGFLARGRVPVWINKLAVDDGARKRRPDDVFFLTDYLSDAVERELNWQVMDVDALAEHWLNAPAAYLSSHRTVDLSAEQKANLKRYLDLGGILLAVPGGGSQGFVDSVRELGTELYPKLTWRELPEDHLLFNAQAQVDPQVVEPVAGLSNGARDLILLPTRDWALTYQNHRQPGSTDVWRIARNFFALSTERGSINNRLVPAIEPRATRKSTGTVTVGHAMYQGLWNVEPAAHELFAVHVFNRCGVEVKSRSVAVTDLADCGLPLVHLMGVQRHTFSDEQLQAIADYIRGGGTVFVETVGGRGDFAQGLEQQLADYLKLPVQRLDSDSPVLSGRGLPGGYDCSRATYRLSAGAVLNRGTRHRLATMPIDPSGRDGIIFAHDDVTLAVMDVRKLGILGYSVVTARNLMTNLILLAGL